MLFTCTVHCEDTFATWVCISITAQLCTGAPGCPLQIIPILRDGMASPEATTRQVSTPHSVPSVCVKCEGTGGDLKQGPTKNAGAPAQVPAWAARAGSPAPQPASCPPATHLSWPLSARSTLCACPQGVCNGLKEVMENATRTQLADHLADLLQPIQVPSLVPAGAAGAA